MPPVSSLEPDPTRDVLAKVSRRLIPFLLLLYVVAYLDRVNVGFAALQMTRDLRFSASVYGLGAGIFFIGYFFFEVPSNLILHRVGARRWIARIMISWGLISAAMAFVTNPATFYAMRFLLGAAEAGFFPGIVLYLTYWFPPAERAHAVARLMTGVPLASLLGGPVSGLLLGLDGRAGLAGWQWLFLAEGLPAFALGFVVLGFMTDRPEEAEWLDAGERASIAAGLDRDRTATDRAHTLRQALSSPGVWLLALVYFLIINGLYGMSLWLPQILKSASGLGDLEVGLASAVPYVGATVAMMLVARHSDRTGERRRHLAASAFVAASGMALSAGAHTLPTQLLALSLAAVGIMSAFGPFWATATGLLRGEAAAGGIALINSIGNLGGFVSPTLIGFVKDATGSYALGLLAVAAALTLAGFLAWGLRDTRRGQGRNGISNTAT